MTIRCFVFLLLLLAFVQSQAQPYVPRPKPARTDYLVGALYFAGWDTDSSRNPWAKIVPFPNRKPYLGWYDEGSPEVADWEIKWALEHGISYFTYCWYRKPNNLGKPVSDTTHFKGHAIHKGLFRARYRDQFRFSILWENQGGAGVASVEDFKQNVFPYWLKTYFRHPSYLKVDGKPVLHFYKLTNLIDQLGSRQAVREVVDWMRAECVRAGFRGMLVLSDNRWARDGSRAECGIDAVYFYTAMSGGKNERPTAQQVISGQLTIFDEWIHTRREPVIPFAVVGWDPMPWARKDPRQPWYDPDLMTRWQLDAVQFRQLLTGVKARMDSLPATVPGRRMILLSNWNEWGEGMHLAPHEKEGFGYLDAVRAVFTTEPQPADHRRPEDLKLGPYDRDFRRFNTR